MEELKYNGTVAVRRRKRTNYGQKKTCNKQSASPFCGRFLMRLDC